LVDIGGGSPASYPSVHVGASLSGTVDKDEWIVKKW
jgi:hypothetical protein